MNEDTELESRELYLADVWQVLMRSKWTIIAFVLVFSVLAVIYSLTATPYYRSTVLLSVVEHNKDGGGLSGLAGQLGGVASFAGLGLSASGSRNEYLAMLGSRQFAERFINENNLLPEFFSDDWDAVKGEWLVDDPEAVPTIQDAWELFNEDIRSIRVDGETDLISLSIEWKDRDLAAQWANELVARINKELRQRAIDDANRSLVFLNRELEKTTVLGLRQGLFRLMETKKQDEMLANVREEFAFRILDPAFASDADSEVRPMKAFIVIVSAFLGGLLGVFIALLRGYVFAPSPRR